MSDYYRGFPLTQNEAAHYLYDGALPGDFSQRVRHWLEFGMCENCGGVRCMHFVMRDWWDPDFDACGNFCCPDCDEYAKSLAAATGSAAVSEPEPEQQVTDPAANKREITDVWAEIERIPDSGRSPCFAPCGDDICKDHGCRHVYRSKPSVPQEQAQ